MNCYIAGTALVIFNTMALSMSIFYPSVNAQQLTNFVDLNQSRQFFDQGNKQIELEQKLMQKDAELPTIKLPQDYEQPQSSNESLSVERGWRIKPVSNTDIDHEQ